MHRLHVARRLSRAGREVDRGRRGGVDRLHVVRWRSCARGVKSIGVGMVRWIVCTSRAGASGARAVARED
jgi:hypothetical protein